MMPPGRHRGPVALTKLRQNVSKIENNILRMKGQC